MQPRLTRSATESMVAGVCGGLADYFNIDPVIVRLIFVLVTLTSGLGLPVYLVLWILMPKAVAPQGQQTLDQGVRPFGQEATPISREVMVGQRQGGQSQARGGPAGPGAPAPEYRFDPQTGQPLGPDSATGQTVNLTPPPAELPTTYAPTRRGRSWNTLGLILIGIGGLIFLEQFGIDMSLIFPALLIVAGVILLRRKR